MQSITNTKDFIVYDEVFVPITDIAVPDIKPYYLISNYGNVWSNYSNTYIIPHETENGYLQVSLMTNTGRVFRKIHRIELLSFGIFPKNESDQVNHIYGNKKDNYLYHLEWITGSENVIHAINTGLRKSFSGENNPKAIITEKQAREISKMIIDNIPDNEISHLTGVNESIIKSIANGSTWASIFTQEELQKMKETRRGYYISTKNKHLLCLFFQNNKDNYKKVIQMVKDALAVLNLEISDRNIRIAKRLYYRYDNPEITSLYNY